MPRPRGPMRWDAARLVPARRGRDVTIRESGKKECGVCGHWFPESDFWKNPGARDGLTGYCRLCHRAASYGTSWPALLKRLEEQQFACLVCGCDITESWVVDHDWSCCPVRKGSCGNCTRGLLCSRCNHGIGYFEGRIHALQGAYNYLSGAKTPVAGRK
jgi:hypothetical protein